jgi:hypothetical protein
MRYDLGRFERKNETAGDLFRPGREDALVGHAIKGIIDLYRVEASRIEAKHFLGRNLLRVEFSLPFFIRISTCTDVDFHSVTSDRNQRYRQTVTKPVSSFGHVVRF